MELDPRFGWLCSVTPQSYGTISVSKSKTSPIQILNLEHIRIDVLCHSPWDLLSLPRRENTHSQANVILKFTHLPPFPEDTLDLWVSPWFHVLGGENDATNWLCPWMISDEVASHAMLTCSCCLNTIRFWNRQASGRAYPCQSTGCPESPSSQALRYQSVTLFLRGRFTFW